VGPVNAVGEIAGSFGNGYARFLHKKPIIRLSDFPYFVKRSSALFGVALFTAKDPPPDGVAENVERAPHAFFAMVRFDNFLEPVFWVLQRNR
jgi:hypothetical protein